MAAGTAISLLLGITSLLIFTIIAVAIFWFVEIIRTAINDDLSKRSKILWILGQLFIPLVPMVCYMLFVERNLFIRISGIIITLAFAFIFGVAHFMPKDVNSLQHSKEVRESVSFQQCINLMTDFAVKKNSDPEIYIARNQPYLKTCMEFYDKQNSPVIKD